jgi:hypothetical protein
VVFDIGEVQPATDNKATTISATSAATFFII